MKTIVSTLVLLIGIQAKAGFLVDPYLGYSQGTLKTTAVSANDSGATNSGMEYGARLGYRFNQGFWLAAEYGAGSGKSKSDTVGIADSDYAKSAMSAVFGYDTGRFSFWLGYGVSDKLTVKSTGSADTDFTGTNMRVGFGVKATQHVSVNFDYVIPKYTKFTQSGTENDISTFYSKFDTSGMMLSVGFPFDLGK